MKVLTAAPFTYAGVEVGFCDCEPGELVMLGETCECECHPYDEEDCGCSLDCRDDASFVGLDSRQGTTTARVEERDVSEPELTRAIRKSLSRAGWFVPGVTQDLAPVLVQIEVERIREVSALFTPGTLVALSHGVPFEVHGELGRQAVRRGR